MDARLLKSHGISSRPDFERRLELLKRKIEDGAHIQKNDQLRESVSQEVRRDCQLPQNWKERLSHLRAKSQGA